MTLKISNQAEIVNLIGMKGNENLILDQEFNFLKVSCVLFQQLLHKKGKTI